MEMRRLFIALIVPLLIASSGFAGFTTAAWWEVRTTGDNTNNGGGFDGGVAGFPTDLACTVANTAAPVCTSASYTFLAGDVGAWLYVNAGTNWTQGYYKVASVSAGAATLDAAVGHAVLRLANGKLSTVGGCATIASPTGGTWGIDYSQRDTAQFTSSTLAIDGVTNTKLTDGTNTIGQNWVGNIISITAGTGFTVQRVAVVSVSGTTATVDKSLGTLGSTNGTGSLGGGITSIATASGLIATMNVIWIKSGTYTLTTAVALPALGGAGRYSLVGYQTTRGDRTGTRPLITTATNSTNLFGLGGSPEVFFANLSLSNTAVTRANGIAVTSNYSSVFLIDSVLDGFTNGIDGITAGNAIGIGITNTEIKNCSLSAATGSYCGVHVYGSYIHDNTQDGIVAGLGNQGISASRSVFANNGARAIYLYNGSGQLAVSNCVFYRNGRTFTGHPFSALTVNSGAKFYQISNSIFYGAENNTIDYVYIPGQEDVIARNNAADQGLGVSFIPSFMYPNHYLGYGDILLTADPFTNAAGGDFSLNSAAGGGALLKAAGIQWSGNPALDIGAIQRAAGGGQTGSASAN